MLSYDFHQTDKAYSENMNTRDHSLSAYAKLS